MIRMPQPSKYQMGASNVSSDLEMGSVMVEIALRL